MEYAKFSSLLDAKAYRKNKGGWIFITEFGEAFWFSLEYTPTRIFLSKVLSGLSGRLI
jgi:hypothetical protein